MDNWQFWIGLTFVFLGILNCLIGTIYRLGKKNKSYADIFLCIGFFAIQWHTFIYALLYTGLIAEYPLLYNKGIPLYYLIGPCFYFYIHYKIHPSDPLPNYWYLHLIPFLFGLVDIIPYAISSHESQLALVKIVVSDFQMGFKHSYGFIDQKWHYLLRFGLAFFYVIAQWRLLFLYESDTVKKGTFNLLRKRKIFLFSCLYSCYLAMQGSVVLAVVLNNTQGSFTLRNIEKLFPVSFFFLLFTFWFFFCSVPALRRWYQQRFNTNPPIRVKRSEI